MPETKEETVSTEPKGASAFDSARASVRASSEAPEPETPPDDTSASEPAHETETPADEPPETGTDTDTVLSPEQLAKLSAKDRANAEKWQAGLTQRSQALKASENELKARENELKEWLPLIEALKTNPDAAIEQLAQRQGFTVSKAQRAAAETKAAQTAAELPEELQFLKPVFEEYGKKLLDNLRGEIAPIKQATDQMMTQAVAAETEATLKSFSAKYPGWEKYERAMIEEGKSILPGQGMDDFKYLERLYKLVTADVTEAEKTKKVVEKINKSAESSEQKKSGVPDSRVAHSLPPPDKRSMRDAYEAAKRGEAWEKT